MLGHWNGYVEILRGHPAFGKGYDEINGLIEDGVHGGLAWAADHCPGEEPRGTWWVGFDCGHYNDLSPYLAEKSPHLADQTYRDIEYVLAEVRSLAAQLANIASPQSLEIQTERRPSESGPAPPSAFDGADLPEVMQPYEDGASDGT